MTIPDTSNGDMLVMFDNIPTPVDSESYFTSQNGNNARSFKLVRTDKSIRAGGSMTGAVWLSSTCTYITNELI